MRPTHIPSTDRHVLTKRQMDVDPLTVIFNTITNIPANKDECWLSRCNQQLLSTYRRELFHNLAGPSQRRYKIVARCGNKKCINPWHAGRDAASSLYRGDGMRYYHPDVEDREALLSWYSAGNSPIRALDVSHVQEIFQATGTDLRSHKRRKAVSSRS